MFEHNPLLNEELNYFSPLFSETLSELYRESGELGQACLYTCLGKGKRIRPLLCLLSLENQGMASKASGLRAAMALEMIHCYSLCHDDLPAMDDDEYRRGQLTTHKKYDEATAILAGDALLTDAFLLLCSKGFPSLPTIPSHLLSTLVEELATASGSFGMVMGQALDMQATGKDTGISLAQVKKIHRLKTGALISSAMAMGAWLGTGSEEVMDRYREIGQQLGTAFQIWDDLLDIQGSVQSLGKTPGKDAAQGKLTFLTFLSPNVAREQAEKLWAEAENRLRKHPVHSPALFDLIGFLRNRDY